MLRELPATVGPKEAPKAHGQLQPGTTAVCPRTPEPRSGDCPQPDRLPRSPARGGLCCPGASASAAFFPQQLAPRRRGPAPAGSSRAARLPVPRVLPQLGAGVRRVTSRGTPCTALPYGRGYLLLPVSQPASPERVSWDSGHASVPAPHAGCAGTGDPPRPRPGAPPALGRPLAAPRLARRAPPSPAPRADADSLLSRKARRLRRPLASAQRRSLGHSPRIAVFCGKSRGAGTASTPVLLSRRARELSRLRGPAKLQLRRLPQYTPVPDRRTAPAPNALCGSDGLQTPVPAHPQAPRPAAGTALPHRGAGTPHRSRVGHRSAGAAFAHHATPWAP